MQHRILSQAADTATTPWSLKIATSALSRYSLTKGRWHYKDGLLFKGIYQLWQQTGDSRYWQSLAAYVDRYVTAPALIIAAICSSSLFIERPMMRMRGN